MKSQLWETGAHQRWRDLQIPIDSLLASHGLVSGAMGSEWIRQHECRMGVNFRNLTDAHPLYARMTSSDDQSLVTVCELAEYLRHFKDDPAIGAIISDLRSDKFDATVAELATAYRWSRAGAAIKLHPPTPSGEADFEAMIYDLPYVVEISSVNPEEELIRRLRLEMIVSDVITDVFKKERAVAVKIRIESYPTGDVEGKFRVSVARACRRLAGETGQLPVTESTEAWSIEAEQIQATTEQNPFTVDEYARVVHARGHDWDSYLAVTSSPKPDEQPTIAAVGSLERTEHGRIFMKFPRGIANPYEKIRKKLKKELRQLRGIRDPRVVALELTGLTDDVFKLGVPQLRNEILSTLSASPELACVWLLMRKWTTAFRHKYFGIYIPNPEGVFQLPHSFLSALMEFEHRQDFLGGREFIISNDEGDLKEYARRSTLRPRSARGHSAA